MKIVQRDNAAFPFEGLKDLFSRNGISVRTKRKISFERQPTGQIIGTFTLKSNVAHGINIDLVTDYDSLEHLIEVHGLQKPDDIHQISVSDFWVRYLYGNGYVCVDIEAIDAELCFRIVKSITMVYSADMSFYQEIPHALSMTDQFERFVMENMHRFVIAVGMRPLLLPEEVWVP